jgi:hypothetical protein
VTMATVCMAWKLDRYGPGDPPYKCEFFETEDLILKAARKHWPQAFTDHQFGWSQVGEHRDMVPPEWAKLPVESRLVWGGPYQTLIGLLVRPKN